MKPLKIRIKGRNKGYNDLPKSLRYGKTYYLAFAGITEGIEFTLKKKKFIACEWIDGTVTYESLKWIRKILNDGNAIHFFCEMEKE